jgi:SAM-dependent methyltransferase
MRVAVKSIDLIRRHGLVRTGQFLHCVADDLFFDLRYRIETGLRVDLKRLNIESENKPNGLRYEGTPTIPFCRLMALMDFPRDSVFVDFGSGKGKALIAASLFGFKKVVGVEFSKELCEISRRNVENYIVRKKDIVTEFEIFEIDAVNYRIRDDENIFYFYNPFTENVLIKVLCNIINSNLNKPRKILIIYCHPAFHKTVEQTNKFYKIYEFGYGFIKISVYECH